MKKPLFIVICAFILVSGAISLFCEKFPLPIGCTSPGYASSLDTSLNLVPIDTSGTTLHNVRVVNVYPHDPAAFTQGLAFHKGYLYEGTGISGQSSIRKVELKTGRVLKHQSLPAEHFGEGIAICRNKLIQLTWQSHTAFVYDLQSFRLVQTFSYLTEGWGITCDGNHLIMSDGTAVLRFLNSRTYKMVRQIEVLDRGKSLPNINELEYIKGEIYANVWGTDYIVRISPRTGQVLGWVDLRDLYRYVGAGRNIDVLNGIAYDAKGDRLFVTGKYWPNLFEIRLEAPK
ncbi:MAG TPA: glutaminyl-peptide cyclotransferase [Syntrophales bacterium]